MLRLVAVERFEGRTIYVWGMSFMAVSEVLLDSPAIEVARQLVAEGAKVRAYDPEVAAGADVLEGVEVVDDPYACCDGADALVVLTEWPEFSRMDLDRVAAALAQRAVVDTRNVLDRAALARREFTYQGIGRV